MVNSNTNTSEKSLIRSMRLKTHSNNKPMSSTITSPTSTSRDSSNNQPGLLRMKLDSTPILPELRNNMTNTNSSLQKSKITLVNNQRSKDGLPGRPKQHLALLRLKKLLLKPRELLKKKKRKRKKRKKPKKRRKKKKKRRK